MLYSMAATAPVPEPSMRVLVCPSGFKGSLQPDTAADCIEAGILAVEPDAKVRKVPLVDGGEGFTRALVASTNGTLHPTPVMGPVGEPILSFFGMLGQSQDAFTTTPTPKPKPKPKTAVIEMAAAAGLSLVPASCRNPGVTTTFGVGQLILAALGAGAERILIGCGDSGTCDGGAGMLQALGARLLDRDGLLRPRYEVVMEYIALDGLFDDCDLVLTAEGGIDDQTPWGKIPGEIARRAKNHGLPVIAIAGTIGPGARVNYDVGIDAFTCILQRPTTLDDAVTEAEMLTRESAETVMRIVAVGRMLGLSGRSNVL
ncbi:putative gamma-glutamyl phosphate reductase [Emericellopsis cladophorae]|uniref:Gamma-glutamyl phosphate reductase n=1 Tax=Emericellopsis cladophorae TaxID=2686198 RepID=A0A9P9Y4R3_9HYPO|nr:putative gamma-glutamyl phosphate reductase [Emericellopsis cladophorae]KAI6783461.1 putative gamma-glutamyl phosphate reductase [Emericellopsis cladophorae]